MSVPLYQAKAEFFKTLGHPARIRILELLSERDHAVHELLEKIAIEPSNLSQQLAVLRRTSLVVSHRQGGEVTYSVSVPEVRDLLLAARRSCPGSGSFDGYEAPRTPASPAGPGSADRTLGPADRRGRERSRLLPRRERLDARPARCAT